MKTFIFLCCVSVFSIAPGNLVSQNAKIKIAVNETLTVNQVFELIMKQTDYNFIYEDQIFKDFPKVMLKKGTISLNKLINESLSGKDVNIIVTQNNTILIKDANTQQQINVTGTITGASGQPIPGVTVLIKGTLKGTATDFDGSYTIIVPNPENVLVFSALGYETQEIVVGDQNNIDVIMKEAASKLEEVIVTGIYKRKKESFTGAATTFTGDELKTIGNKNVLTSLQTLDPSFVMVENNIKGSNPNQLPNFEIRGKTTINTASTEDLNSQFGNDPNQPLFILDGFESTLQAIYDLDINRVKSITILKDAASTALYGSRASNGVIVVETKRPTGGKLSITYTGDFSYDVPDLRSYNLMNAAEKLEFEKQVGIYSDQGSLQWEADEVYARRLAEIQRGVDTYWLSEPVQMGVTSKHSVQMYGGSENLFFNGGVFLSNIEGVMKGSVRKTWGSNISVTYRKDKLNITNLLSFNGSRGKESPYGSFSNFAQANPYYRKRNLDGTNPKFLDSIAYGGANLPPNPLYNASLSSIDENKGFSLTNNTQLVWDFSNDFRLQGGVQIANSNTTGVVFVSPEHTQFEGVDIRQKGSYTNTHIENRSYSANVMLSYGKVINKHQFNANIRGDIAEDHFESTGFSAVGFPYGTNGNLIFASSYAPYGSPSASTTTSRSVGFMSSFNYVFDQRFLFDAVYRLDGSTVFGSNQVFRPFASAGLGWNLHQEPFLKNSKWLNLLKLRANIGLTGNENLGQFTSVSTYTSTAEINNFGIGGLNLISLGNPNLEWQNTRQISSGIEFTLWQNRVSGYVEYYDKLTDPLVVPANGILPSSVGINSNYVLNVGNLATTGWLYNLRISPIYNLKDRIIWTIGLTGGTSKSVYGGLGNKLDSYNMAQQESQGLLRYKDGYSPDDIWAIVSKGIDPATGTEIFQKKDGSLTAVYDPQDVVKVGNTRPKLEGVINTSFTYKDFTFGANLRYRIGGYVFNSALYEKVENIKYNNIIYNQDKRALYDRWQAPGDVSQFSAVRLNYFTPNLSSRFVQKDSHLIGESISLSWRKSDDLIKSLGFKTLNLNLYLNDLFRIETVKSERGIDYPFSRSVAFSLNVSF
ncbi:SusC/RagA family TonB-linked outer membrane protein [Flavivirga sp. 57AJ16]|uniref:SusC/RagA family TonB-linked outer membrane protein n=1 Tax=Flavivirga sp. 57AJ16 TaxID=3025307 RepID=UPI0023670582|nr:SusC/RagA family TonB-linked outer membrane protein [Flavivirga sp. 57AJ16]MDD7885090.1 SusC/RagA family TonB-linked outer membrane protein [Flavivirga sp. 57AJ16]